MQNASSEPGLQRKKVGLLARPAGGAVEKMGRWYSYYNGSAMPW